MHKVCLLCGKWRETFRKLHFSNVKSTRALNTVQHSKGNTNTKQAGGRSCKHSHHPALGSLCQESNCNKHQRKCPHYKIHRKKLPHCLTGIQCIVMKSSAGTRWDWSAVNQGCRSLQFTGWSAAVRAAFCWSRASGIFILQLTPEQHQEMLNSDPLCCTPHFQRWDFSSHNDYTSALMDLRYTLQHWNIHTPTTVSQTVRASFNGFSSWNGTQLPNTFLLTTPSHGGLASVSSYTYCCVRLFKDHDTVCIKGQRSRQHSNSSMNWRLCFHFEFCLV